MNRSPKTLIIAAHPDDEVLGAGGWAAHFPGTHVAVVSEGTSREGGDVLLRLAAKRQATKAASEILKSKLEWEGDFPDQRLMLTQPFMACLETLIETIRPVYILTHHPQELNQDHRILAEAVAIAARPYCKSGASVKMLLGFSVDPWPAPGHAFRIPMQFFLPLSEAELEIKKLALQCYDIAGALREWPHPRSVTSQIQIARVTGSQIGVPAAESYSLIWGQML